VNVVRRARRELLPPGADLGHAQAIDPRGPMRGYGVLQSVAERLERDVLRRLDERLPRRGGDQAAEKRRRSGGEQKGKEGG
jgi:hypothetical protein